MNIETFRRISRQVQEFEKNNINFDVNIIGDSASVKGCATAYFEPSNFEVKTLKQLSLIQSILARPIQFSGTYNKYDFSNKEKIKNCVKQLIDLAGSWRQRPEEKDKYPSVKFHSSAAGQQFNFNIYLISSDPFEEMEDGVTYRYIGDSNTCQFCIPHTHQLYNYLDRGYLYIKVQTANKEKIFITNELTVDTYLCLTFLSLCPQACKHLQHECFLNANLAKAMRIKFEKEYPATTYYPRRTYDIVKDVIFKEYEKSANDGLFEKLLTDKLPSGSFNSIKLTKTSAQYESISITAKDLLPCLRKLLVFDNRTDIYTIVRTYISKKIAEIESHTFDYDRTPVHPTTPGGITAAQVEENAKVLAERKAIAEADQITTFVVNGINITLKRVATNTRRYVNDIMINKDEVEPVCHRATCLNTQELFDKFVNSVNEMSLRWHDALANGVGVKINDTLTHEEYRRAGPPACAPKLRFRKEGKIVKLLLPDEASVKIKFNKFLDRIETINRKTNGRRSNRYYDHNAAHNGLWARLEVIKLLIECCTFDRKQLIVDGNNQPVLDALGKKRYDTFQDVLLTVEQAGFVEKMAREYSEKALKKAEIFLATAIKATEAKLQNFRGEDHYVVQGLSGKKYAVHSKNNKVHNFDTGAYVCIVENGNDISIGGDATAARLYALKNDALVVKAIHTIG